MIRRCNSTLTSEQIKESVVQLTADWIIRTDGDKMIFDINRFELMYGKDRRADK